MRMRRSLAFLTVLLSISFCSRFFVSAATKSDQENTDQFGEPFTDEFLASRKPPIVLVPGMLSSRLRAYGSSCFDAGETVWMAVESVILSSDCWLQCMKLDPLTMDDSPQCKLRVDEGLTAIGQLQPGLVTGHLSRVWQGLLRMLVQKLGYDTNDLVAAPYDFRLPFSLLERRDGYFSRLKETLARLRRRWLAQNGRNARYPGAWMIAHSQGNLVLDYFFEWLRRDIGVSHFQAWVDDHVDATWHMGAPFLGSPSVLEPLMMGLTFGLPLSLVTTRELWSTHAGGAALFPKDACTAPPGGWKTPPSAHRVATEDSCDREDWYRHLLDEIDTLAYRGGNLDISEMRWPDDLVSIDWDAEDDTAAVDREKVTSYSVGDFYDRLWQDVAMRGHDPAGEWELRKLQRYWFNDVVRGVKRPARRPPVRRVYCAYGVNMDTPVKVHIKQTEPYDPLVWEARDGEGALEKTTAEPGSRKTGDGSVPYRSLAWCHHAFMAPRFNVTRFPARDVFHESETVHIVNARYKHNGKAAVEFAEGEEDDDDEEEEDTVLEEDGIEVDVFVNNDFGVESTHGEPHISIYESRGVVETFADEDGDTAVGGRMLHTAVWEFSHVEHREVLESSHFFGEFTSEMLHVIRLGNTEPSGGHLAAHASGQAAHSSRFLDRVARMPHSDEDCLWDYRKARCKFPHFCEYQYNFGDIHLSQSCRLKALTRQVLEQRRQQAQLLGTLQQEQQHRNHNHYPYGTQHTYDPPPQVHGKARGTRFPQNKKHQTGATDRVEDVESNLEESETETDTDNDIIKSDL
ncbi:MAG: hypothetical protein MHM6MM_003215 [Cercozoa sp. M6MM]